MTRASSSDCTKKASQQDRFLSSGHTVTSVQSPNQARTIASWTDIIYSQCKTPRESWWNKLWPGSLPRTWKGEMYFSPKPRRVQSRKNHLGKCSQICIWCLQRISEEETNCVHSSWSGGCVQQSAVQTADGTPCTIWRQLDPYMMARSNTPGKKGHHATWKFDLLAPTTDNGTFTRLPSVPSPLQCLHKGSGRSEQQWYKPGAYACKRQAYLQNSQWHPHSSHCCLGAAGKSVTPVSRDRV